jgi:hypothetical protein
MSMALINTALSRCERTLCTLHLNVDRQIWMAHSGTKLDLRSLTALSDISCPSSLFFHPSHFGVERAGFYKLLPPSLERLTVLHLTLLLLNHSLTSLQLMFGPDSGIFFPSPDSGWEEDFEIFREKDTDRLYDDTWLRELVLNKHSSFSELHHVDLIDLDQKYSRTLPWEPKRRKHFFGPMDITDAFQAADISLRIEIRPPMQPFVIEIN